MTFFFVFTIKANLFKQTYIELFKHIAESNVTTLIISLICIAVLYPIKLINMLVFYLFYMMKV